MRRKECENLFFIFCGERTSQSETSPVFFTPPQFSRESQQVIRDPQLGDWLDECVWGS